jgi:DNA primase
VLCPFLADKRPSCRVELDRKIFHCCACEASGNILEFVASGTAGAGREGAGGRCC